MNPALTPPDGEPSDAGSRALIDQLVDRILAKLPPDQAGDAAEFTRQPSDLSKPGLHQRQRQMQPPAHGHRHRVLGRQVEPADQHVAAHHWLQVAVGKVQPIEVLHKVRVCSSHREPVTTIPGEDVVNHRTGLGQQHIPIGDNRRGAQRVQCLEFGWRQVGYRIADVVLERVADVQLLAEPDDAFRLRFAQVVDCQHGDSPFD